MDDPVRMEREDEEIRLKEEAKAKERAEQRLINQTKHVQCTLVHGSRIGLRASQKGYGLGLSNDGIIKGGHAIIHRLVGVQYLEHQSDGPESPNVDGCLGTLQMGDRVVKVNDTMTPEFELVLEAITASGVDGSNMELTVLRDPNKVPDQMLWRDRQQASTLELTRMRSHVCTCKPSHAHALMSARASARVHVHERMHMLLPGFGTTARKRTGRCPRCCLHFPSMSSCLVDTSSRSSNRLTCVICRTHV